MNENNKERSLADVEKTFYKTMSKNTVFSSLNRSASALESLTLSTNALTRELKNASNSSTNLSLSLNETIDRNSDSQKRHQNSIRWLTIVIALSTVFYTGVTAWSTLLQYEAVELSKSNLLQKHSKKSK